MSLRIFALLTNQGTAALETMICGDDLRVVPAVLSAINDAASDVDTSKATFEDVSDNDEAACHWCGRTPGDD